MKNAHDALIARLPDEVRRKILDALCHRDHLVSVEYSWERKLDGATTLVGTPVGVAYHPGGGCSTVLVVKPLDPKKRMVALPASQVLRVRMASQPWKNADQEEWRDRVQLGEVLAGPPLKLGIGSALLTREEG